METALRPLTLGEILDRTAHLYRANFVLFAGISSVYAGAVLVLGLIQIGMRAFLAAKQLHSQLIWMSTALVALEFAVIIMLSGVQVAANNRAVAWVHLGQPATVRSAYAGVLKKAGRYVWLMTIVMFLVGWPVALFYGGVLAAVFVWMRPLTKNAMATGANGAGTNPETSLIIVAISLIFLVVFGLAIAYAVVIGLRYALAVPACVVEDLKARAAIRRSIELGKGARGRIFVLGLLVFVIQFGLVMATQSFFIVLGFKHHGQLSAGTRVLQQLVAFATNTFIGPMYATGLTLFYYDQRVRKEGYDIEWMMQAARMTAEISAGLQLTAEPAPGAGAAGPTANAEASLAGAAKGAGTAHE